MPASFSGGNSRASPGKCLNSVPCLVSSGIIGRRLYGTILDYSASEERVLDLRVVCECGRNVVQNDSAGFQDVPAIRYLECSAGVLLYHEHRNVALFLSLLMVSKMNCTTSGASPSDGSSKSSSFAYT